MLFKFHWFFIVSCLAFAIGFGVYRFRDWRGDGSTENLAMVIVCAVITVGLLVYLRSFRKALAAKRAASERDGQ